MCFCDVNFRSTVGHIFTFSIFVSEVVVKKHLSRVERVLSEVSHLLCPEIGTIEGHYKMV